MPDASRSSLTRHGATTAPPSSSTSSIDRLSELLQRVAKKDHAAFQQLYNATSAKLYATVLRILQQRGWAEDVVQEAYVTIWLKAEQFDPQRASPITWMATIARHGAIDELRRQPRSPREPEEALAQTISSDPTSQERLQGEQEALRLQRCLEELERERQDMVRLAYLDGWSRADLATHFDQPVNTVKTWLHRALKQLKGCLAS
ncbi:sigma-70 family RNA polymerase sigma factor [Billgrantia sp. C5P2]|uniref:sigma-70 family RNA polymerase sigma factor n=1 Tax=Billgrantia sp. C5P2 TaxID=3436239 RepID=UPI003DA1CFF9